MAAVAASFTETEVTFSGPEGFPLAGILCQPGHNNSNSTTSSSRHTFNSRQCAILCHGFASHKNGFHFPAIAAHLATHLGLSSLRFDYTGNMDSPGPFRFGGFMAETHQVAAAKWFLEQQHGQQVILLLGHSRGAINATLYSGQQHVSPTRPQQQQQQEPLQQQHAPQLQGPLHQQQALQQQPAETSNGQHASNGSNAGCSSSWSHIIPLVVLVAGRYDLTLNMKQRYGPDVLQQLQQSGPWQQKTRRDGDGALISWQLRAEDMEERFALDVAGACQAISQMPEAQRPKVLVLHGAEDPICEASDAENLAGHIAGAELLRIEGADHWFKDRQQQLLEAVSEFVLHAGRLKGLSNC